MLRLISLICKCQRLRPTDKVSRRDSGCPVTVLPRRKKHQRKKDVIVKMNVIIIFANSHI